MVQLLEQHNIDVPYLTRRKEPKNHVAHQEHCLNVILQGNIFCVLSSWVKPPSYNSHTFDLDTNSNMYEFKISIPSLEESQNSSLEPPLTPVFHMFLTCLEKTISKSILALLIKYLNLMQNLSWFYGLHIHISHHWIKKRLLDTQVL